MRCPGCQNSQIVGAVPTPNGQQFQPCPLCSQWGTPGIYPGPGVGYFYQINFSLTNQVGQLGTIKIRAANDFLWQAAIATRVGTFTTLIDINNIQFQSVFNQQGQLQAAAGINDTNFWGTQNNPFPLFTPIPMRANDLLSFTLTDTSGASGGAPNAIALFLVGANFDAGTFPSVTSAGPNTTSAGGQMS